MVNRSDLRRRTNEVLAAREREEQSRLAEETRKQAEKKAADLARRKHEWPAYIERKVREAAAAGLSQYEFEVGVEMPEQELTDLIFATFADLNPHWERAERREIVNYDLGVDKTYYTNVIVFSW